MSPFENSVLVKSWCKAQGFDDVGIASATGTTPYSELFIQSMNKGHLSPVNYMEESKALRADVQQLMPGAKSVVVVVKNYFTGDHADFTGETKLANEPKISRYAWGGDYHHWFKKRLRRIRKEIHAHFGEESRVHIFNDAGPVLERGWAERAGLGFIGKSAMFIHRKYGTWTFLGGFVTDLELSPDKAVLKSHCGSCTACIDACPTKAILSPKEVNATRCLTMWNVERPLDSAGDDPSLKGHGWAVGCDVCQEVCPWNKFENLSPTDRFKPIANRVTLSAADLQSDLRGTPLARPGQVGLSLSLERALGRKN